jgi:hypothetical protein
MVNLFKIKLNLFKIKLNLPKIKLNLPMGGMLSKVSRTNTLGFEVKAVAPASSRPYDDPATP